MSVLTFNDFEVVPLGWKSTGSAPPPPTRCDVNSSGTVDVWDVQLAVKQAISMATYTTEINLDSLCTVVDVMRVVNAQISGQCVGP